MSESHGCGGGGRTGAAAASGSRLLSWSRRSRRWGSYTARRLAHSSDPRLPRSGQRDGSSIGGTCVSPIEGFQRCDERVRMRQHPRAHWVDVPVHASDGLHGEPHADSRSGIATVGQLPGVPTAPVEAEHGASAVRPSPRAREFPEVALHRLLRRDLGVLLHHVAPSRQRWTISPAQPHWITRSSARSVDLDVVEHPNWPGVTGGLTRQTSESSTIWLTSALVLSYVLNRWGSPYLSAFLA